MTLSLFDPIGAEREKDIALSRLEYARKAWLEKARIIAVMVYRKKRTPISVVDIREAYPAPKEFDPRVYGAVFNDKKRWCATGMAKSGRKLCHNRMVTMFEMVGS